MGTINIWTELHSSKYCRHWTLLCIAQCGSDRNPRVEILAAAQGLDRPLEQRACGHLGTLYMTSTFHLMGIYLGTVASACDFVYLPKTRLPPRKSTSSSSLLLHSPRHKYSTFIVSIECLDFFRFLLLASQIIPQSDLLWLVPRRHKSSPTQSKHATMTQTDEADEAQSQAGDESMTGPGAPTPLQSLEVSLESLIYITRPQPDTCS